MNGTDKYMYIIRDDGKIIAFYDEYHYLAATAYRLDFVDISETEARKIMIKELENEGYFGGYPYGAHFEYADTSEIYDLYSEKVV